MLFFRGFPGGALAKKMMSLAFREALALRPVQRALSQGKL